MTENSKIEWTHHTFNPWIGCTKVSPGCDHCYAEGTAHRFKLAEWGRGKERRLSSTTYWQQPIAWNKRAEYNKVRERVFCASLADVFDNEVPQEWRDRLFQLIFSTPHLDWLLLTKRPGNIAKMLPIDWGQCWPNVWIGCSIVNQEEADRDIPKLLAVPAHVHFLSMEPLLGPVDLSDHFGMFFNKTGGCFESHYSTFNPKLSRRGRIDWVIVGGESGGKARPMNPAWAQALRDQCDAAGVPFFFKQWGEYSPDSGLDDDAVHRWTFINSGASQIMYKVGKRAAGRALDNRLHDAFPLVAS